MNCTVCFLITQYERVIFAYLISQRIQQIVTVCMNSFGETSTFNNWRTYYLRMIILSYINLFFFLLRYEFYKFVVQQGKVKYIINHKHRTKIILDSKKTDTSSIFQSGLSPANNFLFIFNATEFELTIS